ncbi:MAG: hypothetical protein Q7J20_00445, partial [Candidatus Nitrotoga sp.]|nr:hypothetical protein [Candidatus Nitrotoga sp.]
RRNSCQTQANSPVTTAKFTHGLWRNQLFSVSLSGFSGFAVAISRNIASIFPRSWLLSTPSIYLE